MDILTLFKWPITFFLGFVVFIFIFKKDISSFLKETSSLKTKWFELKRIREEIFAKADEVKKLSKELNQDKKDLRKAIIVFTETLYLALETRHRFPIPAKISSEITKNLNLLSKLAIKSRNEKDRFKKRMDEVQELLKKEVG